MGLEVVLHHLLDCLELFVANQALEFAVNLDVVVEAPNILALQTVFVAVVSISLEHLGAANALVIVVWGLDNTV